MTAAPAGRPQIFVSYRRDDTAGYARAIADELAQRYGAERVFIDVDDIGAGQDFANVIAAALGASGVLLVLIGRRWMGVRVGAATRISDPADLVRREVLAGLQGGAHVIPLLLDGATMPDAASLPGDLRALAGRNALAIDHARFAADMARLYAVLDPLLGAARKTRLHRVGIAAAVVMAALAVGTWWLRTPDRAEATQAASAAQQTGAMTARAAIDGNWEADVEYDWPNARYRERYSFGGNGAELHGSASFLRVPRGVLEGRVDTDGLQFITRTTEQAGATTSDIVHRYRGRLVGAELQFLMQTEGGATPHQPVTFIARRTEAPASR